MNCNISKYYNFFYYKYHNFTFYYWFLIQYRTLLPGESSSDGESLGSLGSGNVYVNPTAKNYVESLHQNSKVILLYGKNNVLVLSVKFKLL